MVTVETMCVCLCGCLYSLSSLYQATARLPRLQRLVATPPGLCIYTVSVLVNIIENKLNYLLTPVSRGVLCEPMTAETHR